MSKKKGIENGQQDIAVNAALEAMKNGQSPIGAIRKFYDMLIEHGDYQTLRDHLSQHSDSDIRAIFEEALDDIDTDISSADEEDMHNMDDLIAYAEEAKARFMMPSFSTALLCSAAFFLKGAEE